MKTTLDIQDALLLRAKRLSKRTGKPLRALVEEGLQHVLSSQNGSPTRYTPPDCSVGDPSAPNPGAGDLFILIDATDVSAVPSASVHFTDNTAFKPLVVSSGVYRLMWDIAKSDLPRGYSQRRRRSCCTAA